ncbi:DNA-binding protein WhiA [Spiroplasma tabanidicola]|uniref:Probable cell division protein WhiA n=1 Tax=Spiroplasma tabanidicola TaxID=324079 RepID=A0A6I6CBQ6_9MOLU|nr:DNA-binding protein WhiA [Spiroplasma tabanidicola]QGS51522.1 DNA-binding protein WhiA [Spiroplasma tabanidicola]
MSFATTVKEEILDHNFDKEQAIMLLSGFIKYNGELIYTLSGFSLRLHSKSNHVIRKIYELLKIVYSGNIEISIIQTQILKKDKVYQLLLTDNVIHFLSKYNLYDIDKSAKIIKISLNEDFDNSLVRAYISGVFIAVGSVNNPDTVNYHLELQFKEEESAIYIRDLLNKFEFGFKVITRKSNYICYVKRCLVVSDFLKFIDAPEAVLKFENTRISRDFTNNVNRINNIDVYNIKKTSKTSDKQISQIEAIQKNNLFSELSDKAQKLANIRLVHPDASFSRLEELMNDEGISITKSGISNLFKIIAKLSESIGEIYEK